jgi:flagellin-like protein
MIFMFSKRGVRNKRGISPLIATVLLIAFAVSIGTMIMNWGKDVIANVGDCNDVKLDVQTINGKPLFCYDTLNNKINVMIKNTGGVDIKELRLSVTAADFSHEEKIIDDSALKSGAIITKNIDFIKSGTFKVEIVPYIVSGGKEKACLDKSLVSENIERCN